MEKKEPRLFEVPFPFVIDSLVADGNADKAGLIKNDRIIAINGVNTNSFFHAKEIFGESKGKFAEITIDRSGVTRKIKSYVSKEGTIGVMAKTDWIGLYDFKTKEFNISQSLSKGASFTVEIFGKNISQLKLLFNQNGVKHVGSVLSMRKQFGERWDWHKFWLLTANLSLILAFFNVLPISS